MTNDDRDVRSESEWAWANEEDERRRSASKPTLTDLLAKITPENRHDEVGLRQESRKLSDYHTETTIWLDETEGE